MSGMRTRSPYMNHDIEDAVRAGVLREDDIPWDLKYLLGRTKSDRITTFITAIIENSSDNIRLGQEMQDAYNKLNRFLFDAVYTNPSAKGEEGKAQTLLRYLYRYFASSPEKNAGGIPENRPAGRPGPGGLRLHLRHDRPLCRRGV